MLRTWIIAARPWSFTAALIPIALGTALAWSETLQYPITAFHVFLFLLTLLCGILLQAGTNLLNTYGDYISGVDTVDSAITCPQLVRGMLSVHTMKVVAITILVVAVILGFSLYLLSGWPILVFGFLGFIGAASYTTGIFPYKYKGFGPFIVFLLMGPCMVLPAYYVQIDFLSWRPFFASLPIAFLVTAIMHANDLRDIEHDTLANIKTVAIWLEDKWSLVLYKLLCLSAFLSLIIVVSFGIVPFTGLLPLVLFPSLTAKFQKLGRTGISFEIQRLEGWSAQFHFLFGILYVTGIILWRIIAELIL